MTRASPARRRVAASAAWLMLGIGPSVARAGPPEGSSDEAPVEAEPDPDPNQAEGLALFTEGLAQFELGDYARAIELWERAHAIVPSPQHRVGIRNALADAHTRQYESDHDIQHLRQAQLLLEANRDALDPTDTLTRNDIQTKLDAITAELERVEALAAARERELAEREAEGRAAAVREAELEALRERQARFSLRRHRILVGTGAGLSGLGAAALAVMGAGLALSSNATTTGQARVDEDPSTPAAELQPLVQSGLRYNQMAWATGVAGGVLLASGLTIVVVAAVQRSRSRSSTRAQLRGAVLHF